MTRQSSIVLLLGALCLAVSVTSSVLEVPLTDGASFLRVKSSVEGVSRNHNATDPFMQLEALREFRAQVERERERKNRWKDRDRDRSKAREVFNKLPKSPKGKLERLSEEEWKDIDTKQKNRGLNWFGDSGSGVSAYSNSILADPSAFYDKWAQAYRMLGGFIDCDHAKSANSRDNNNNNNNNNNNGACSRWMLWAAYVNPNYQGNAYDEYFGDNPTSTLDCHNPDSSWQLLGVYRQEFYQYVEQISKHLWAIDEYEYIVALAGLSYMTKYECFYVGQDSSGNSIYAGVAPKPYGTWQMALYTDGPYCLVPNNDLGMTYDSFGLTTDMSLGSGDKNGNGNNYNSDEAATWWSETQEYTLTKLNDVYEEFKYCTSCVDYPTYQDGYFIGDYGTDDDDLINQCWKFYSHSSYTCEADCIAMAHAQGSILAINYGDTVFGKSMSSFYRSKSSNALESKFSRVVANFFVIAAFILFVATFLAFAVARRSRYRESRSSKSRRLLDDDAKRSRSVRRSKSSTHGGGEGDGLFRTPSSTRSKSRSKSKSKSRSGTSSGRSRSKSYEAPKDRSSRTTKTAAANSGDYF